VVAIGLSGAAAARIRFAISCLSEVAASVRVLRDASGHAVYGPWVSRVGRPLAADSLLWQLIPAWPGYLPDFLTPAAAGLVPDLDAELTVLRATPPDRVRAELALYEGRRRPAVRELHEDPEAGLHRLAAEIAEYWHRAIAPDWPRIRTLLEAEVFQRARTLAEDGAAVLLNDLHERVRWEGETLRIASEYCTAPDVPQGDGLVLVPSAFVWPSVLSIHTGERSQLAYPARGVATLWECPSQTPAALGAVIGRGRAELLTQLGAPVSTTDLARRTGMSAGGVSQHLGALRGAGLVTTHRRGRTVLNVRTTLAEALISAATLRSGGRSGG
jgi:DNA-binding transcriptional ArsR family regulator